MAELTPDSYMASLTPDSFMADQSPQQPATWAQKLGVTNPFARGGLDVAEGATSGAASTLFNAGDLIRRGEMGIANALGVNPKDLPQGVRDFFGLDRVIDQPEVKQAMTAPASIPGQIGKYGEQTAEFLIPGSLASKATKGAGLLTRALTQAGTATAVAGAQTGGDPAAMATAGGLGAGGEALAAGMESPAVQSLATKLYQKALKPPVTTAPQDIQAVVQTGLKEGIPISRAGLAKIENLIADLQESIAGRIQAAEEAGVKISPNAVAGRIGEVQERLGSPYSQVNPVDAQRAIERTRQEFLAQHTTPGQAAVAPQATGLYDPAGNPVMTPGTPATVPQAIPIPATQAQRMKVGTYQQLSGKYDEMSNAAIEAQKGLARGLKEELAAAIPQLGPENAREGTLLDLQPLLERAVNRAANNSGGFKDLPAAAAGGVGGSMVGHPAAGATAFGLMSKILTDPAVRSRLAIIINKAQQANPARYGAPSMKTALALLATYEDQVRNAMNAPAETP